jgi:hypothetical protein
MIAKQENKREQPKEIDIKNIWQEILSKML